MNERDWALREVCSQLWTFLYCSRSGPQQRTQNQAKILLRPFGLLIPIAVTETMTVDPRTELERFREEALKTLLESEVEEIRGMDFKKSSEWEVPRGESQFQRRLRIATSEKKETLRLVAEGWTEADYLLVVREALRSCQIGDVVRLAEYDIEELVEFARY